MKKRKSTTIDGVVIKLDEWEGWRIVGNGEYWQVQETLDGEIWRNSRTYPSLYAAVLGTYDHALLYAENEMTSIKQLADFLESVQTRLVSSIYKALEMLSS